MNWNKVKEIMTERGYLQTGSCRKGDEIIEMYFLKNLPVEYEFPITLAARVKTYNKDCDSCWFIELTHAPLALYMKISTGHLPIDHPDWEKVEKVISLYAIYNRNFDPLEKLK